MKMIPPAALLSGGLQGLNGNFGHRCDFPSQIQKRRNSRDSSRCRRARKVVIGAAGGSATGAILGRGNGAAGTLVGGAAGPPHRQSAGDEQQPSCCRQAEVDSN